VGREERTGRSGPRYMAYRAAWLYLCAWVVTVVLGSVPAALRSVSIAVAVVAALFILTVLVKPRPS
jgi:Flp pilus assembly protein TadB